MDAQMCNCIERLGIGCGNEELIHHILVHKFLISTHLETHVRVRSLTLSIISGLLVAATTRTSLKLSTPSISVKSWARTRSATDEPPSFFRWTARASISSKNMIAGAAARARVKTWRTARSESPTHLLNNSGPWNITDKRLIIRTDYPVHTTVVATPQNSSKSLKFR